MKQILLFILFLNVSAALAQDKSPNYTPPPVIREFALAKSKLVVGLTEKKILFFETPSSKALELKGPYFSPKDRWLFANLKTIGKETFLELKVATFPEGTSSIESNVWWVVYTFKNNSLTQKALYGIHGLSQEEFYHAEDTLSRTKTEIRATKDGRIQLLLNGEELKP